ESVAAVDSGVVDEDRNRPDLLGDLLCDREAILALRDVERKALRAAARLADLLRGLRRRRRLDVEQHDARALTRQARGDRAADAGGGARDDGDVTLEKGHGVFLCVWFWPRITGMRWRRYARSEGQAVGVRIHRQRRKALERAHRRMTPA